MTAWPDRSVFVTGAYGLLGSWLTRTIVASSDKAYGAQADLPYRESLPLQPTFPYDVSKAAADMIARSYWHTFGLPVAVTRSANVYGGGDFDFSRLVPEATVAAIERRAPVIRSDGTPQRDFLYVEDGVGAYLAICDLLDAGRAAGEAFNAGAGEIDRQWVDAAKLRDATGWEPRVELEDGLRRTIAWYREHLPSRSEGSRVAQA